MKTRLVTTLAMSAVLVLAACAPAAEEPIAAEPDTGAPATQEPEADVPATEEPEAQAPDTEEPVVEEPGEITAYVVAYHWGWVVFDQDGIELDALEVPVGTTVELFAVNDHAASAISQLPTPVADAIRSTNWHDRAHHAVMAGQIPDPQQTIGVSLSEALTAAHDGHDHMGAARDHGLMVTGVGAMPVTLDAHATEPERLVFVANREGTFEFRCTEDCGFGHDYQRWEMLIVG